MSQFESVSYPKIRQRPDGRVELIVYFYLKSKTSPKKFRAYSKYIYFSYSGIATELIT
jgi:hypothetical protein